MYLFEGHNLATLPPKLSFLFYKKSKIWPFRVLTGIKCTVYWLRNQVQKSTYWNRVPLKPSSPAEFMINLSIQNFIPFLVLFLFPSGLRIIKAKLWGWGGVWNQAGPSWAQKPLCIPWFLFVERGFHLLGFPWVPKSKLKQLLIREVRECRNKGKAVTQEK